MGIMDKLLAALGQGMDATKDIAGRAADAASSAAALSRSLSARNAEWAACENPLGVLMTAELPATRARITSPPTDLSVGKSSSIACVTVVEPGRSDFCGWPATGESSISA